MKSKTRKSIQRKIRALKAKLKPNARSKRHDAKAALMKKLERLRKPEFETMPYVEYLQTEYWRTMRKYIFATRGFRCETCGARNTELHIHHKSYQFRGREHLAPQTLQILCLFHHQQAHKSHDDS